MNEVIYIVEDDENICELIKIALKNSSYITYSFQNAEDALKYIDSVTPHLVILDVMLPGIDGISAVYFFRKKLKFQPIILLTAKSQESDKISGLTSGADDYLTKPFSVMELIARVKLHLNKFINIQQNINISNQLICLENNNFVLDLNSREVLINNNLVNFTIKEFDILAYIVLRPNKPISRKEILSQIWGYEHIGETRTIDIHIKSIRKKIYPFQHKIQTIRGIGYKFIN